MLGVLGSSFTCSTAFRFWVFRMEIHYWESLGGSTPNLQESIGVKIAKNTAQFLTPSRTQIKHGAQTRDDAAHPIRLQPATTSSQVLRSIDITVQLPLHGLVKTRHPAPVPGNGDVAANRYRTNKRGYMPAPSEARKTLTNMTGRPL